MVIVGASTAILPTRFGRSQQGRRYARDWATVALHHIVRFSGIRGSANGRGRQGRAS